MPLIWTWRYWRHKWRHCARCSVTKDVDDNKSNNALAMVVEPSAAITWTWQVVNNTCRQWSLYCVVCNVTLPGVFWQWWRRACLPLRIGFLMQDEAKCGGAFGTLDTYEWRGIASKCGRAWGKWGSTHSASEKLPFARPVNFKTSYKHTRGVCPACKPCIGHLH